MRYLLVPALMLGSLLAFCQRQDHPAGNIAGTVTESNGMPLADATVYAVPQDLTLEGSSPRSVQTDRNGAFDFTGGLPWGDYKVYASKAKDGYPNPLDSFYAGSQPDAPKVELREDRPSSNVTLTVGDKAGTIKGRILDKDSGAPLKGHISFVIPDGGHSVNSAARDGEYRALVPPHKDVLVMVTVFSRGSEHSEVTLPSMRLEPGQEVVLDIPVSSK